MGISVTQDSETVYSVFLDNDVIGTITETGPYRFQTDTGVSFFDIDQATPYYERLVALRGDVAAGADLLDEKRPGWASGIDIDRLAMGMFDHCIIGQLFGVGASDTSDTTYWVEFDAPERQFIEALKTLGIEDDAESYGFDSTKSEYALLELLWVEEISKRL